MKPHKNRSNSDLFLKTHDGHIELCDRNGYNVGYVERLDGTREISLNTRLKHEGYDPRSIAEFDDDGRLVKWIRKPLEWSKKAIMSKLYIHMNDVGTVCLVNDTGHLIANLFSCDGFKFESAKHAVETQYYDSSFAEWDEYGRLEKFLKPPEKYNEFE